MRILIVHNHYGDFAVGGEVLSVRAEAELLRSRGHDVHIYERANSEIPGRSLWGRARAFMRIPWSPEGYAAISEAIDDFKPDIMHVNNYKYLLSPSIFEDAEGHFYINELQALFGASLPYQMKIGDRIGRMVRDEQGDWIFDEGDFCKNKCFNLRVKDVLDNLINRNTAI